MELWSHHDTKGKVRAVVAKRKSEDGTLSLKLASSTTAKKISEADAKHISDFGELRKMMSTVKSAGRSKK